MLSSEYHPLFLKIFFRLGKIVERIIRIDIVFFELFDNDEDEEIHHHVLLDNYEGNKEKTAVFRCIVDYFKHYGMPFFTSADTK